MPEVNRLGEPALWGEERDSILSRAVAGDVHSLQGAVASVCRRGARGWGQGLTSLQNGFLCGLGVACPRELKMQTGDLGPDHQRTACQEQGCLPRHSWDPCVPSLPGATRPGKEVWPLGFMHTLSEPPSSAPPQEVPSHLGRWACCFLDHVPRTGAGSEAQAGAPVEGPPQSQGSSEPAPSPRKARPHGPIMGSRLHWVPALLPSLASSSCRDLGEGTRELAGMAHSVDKDPWTTSCPAGSPHAQVMVHTADLGGAPPASWPTAGMSRQHMAYIPG